MAVDLAIEVGFKRLLIVGHTGKLIKVSGGIMNTHSAEADSRMELMAAAVIEAAKKLDVAKELDKEIDVAFLDEILSQATTTACLDLISEKSHRLLEETSQVILDKILFHLNKRAKNAISIDCILYENSYGLLAKSKNAEREL